MKPIRVLSIGNSFSSDAQRYLHGLARAGGQELKAVNLYIGGCPLSRHYAHMLDGQRAYQFELNGMASGLSVGMKESLLSDDWDFITLQQASHLSPRYETYQPYLTELAAFARQCCPGARLLIHQTWAYERDSERLCGELEYREPGEMFRDLKAAYAKAAASIRADGVLPCGEAFQNALEAGAPRLYRDTYHAARGLGRYLLAAVWYQALTGRSAEQNPFRDFDEPVDEALLPIAQKAAADAVADYGWPMG